MAWTDSRVFRSYVADMVGNALAHDYDADTINVALYNDTITPDNDVATASAQYNAGQWATAQEIYQAGQWAQGGVALASKTVGTGTADYLMIDAADTSSGAAATLNNVYGCLVYNNTLTNKNGMCYNYLGGANSVVGGTFTVRWNASGIMRFAF